MPAVVKSKSKLTRFHSQLGLAWRAEAGKRSMVPCGYLHGTGYIFCLSNHLPLTRSVTRMSRMFALISGCSGRSRTPPIEGAWLMNSLVLMAQCSRSSSARARPVSRPLLAAHKNLSQGRQPAMARQRLYARTEEQGGFSTVQRFARRKTGRRIISQEASPAWATGSRLTKLEAGGERGARLVHDHWRGGVFSRTGLGWPAEGEKRASAARATANMH